ncbi:DUF5685 family protein [Streptomyces sp. NBC_01497]|uniref:DUF5685 family protein n=1 Tax=Streptomyces sp. NBC_01497 TaxID=2903885 RepID=UPI002E30CB25|nr:DUF5685 family protein [Streptomyces sp. NBC_01497]
MFGIIRPCAHRLTESLRTEWMAHLCGLCLALRADHGQLSRVVTNYDGLIVSVLTEAQTSRLPDGRRTAGPCPLRGMRTAPVARGEGARLAAAVSLVLASAKIRDHADDGDGALRRRPVAAAARRVAAGWDRAGARTGAELGFDTAVLAGAAARQADIEAAVVAGSGTTALLAVTEPAATATAAAFAHTAVLAGRPGNREPLAEAGRLFGRLAHLLDAVEDQASDAASGAWNPLTATGTSRAEARRLADDAVHGIRLALRDVDFADGRLAHALLAHESRVAVDRAFGTAGCTHGPSPVGAADPKAPHDPRVPYDPAAPRVPEGPGAPGGPGEPEGPHKPGKRGFLAGCAVAAGLCCTCRTCCAKEFEGPWSGERQEGLCRDVGNCDCSDGDCSGCGDCLQCCQCCSNCDGCDGCDGCDCDCGC